MESSMLFRRVRRQGVFAEADVTRYREGLQRTKSPRLRRLLAQQMTELFCYVQRYEEALTYLNLSVENGLADLNWFYGCPLLKPLWSYPAFVALHEQVKARAQKCLEIL
ncbi:MAG: hypothetical protein H6728_13240 [Myxococcales bacterium]|nr:hypothetical protein [Myxococcales bacterium]MCB9644034.1 hypothetical protein [Myxococcales bacterium]